MKFRMLLVLAVVLCGAVPATATVDPVPLEDQYSSWGWKLNDEGVGVALNNDVWGFDKNLGPPDPSQDVWGTPEFRFTAGEVQLDSTGRQIQSVTINYYNIAHRTLWGNLKPGDLMFDFGADGTWDALVRTPFFNQQQYTAGELYAEDTSWDLYQLSQGPDYLKHRNAGNGVYQLASEAGSAAVASGWNNLLVRGYHPWAFAAAALPQQSSGQVAFTGWDNLYNSTSMGTSTWTFGGTGLVIPEGVESVAIGFTVNCANEVLLGEIPTPLSQVPEPSSIAIWALIAAGGAGFGMRRRNRRWSAENRTAIRTIVERGRSV